MKTLFILFMLMCLNSPGQSVEMKQLMLNIEKLAAMKAQYQTMVNGYRTLENGYRQVSDLAKGNFLLHQDYLDGLLAVSPAVRQNGRIQSILQRHAKMVDHYHFTIQQLRTGSQLKANEFQQLKTSMQELIQVSSQSIDEMIDVLTPGKMRMNDEERISIINRLDCEGIRLSEQLGVIAERYRSLYERRKQKQQELKRMKSLYGIQP